MHGWHCHSPAAHVLIPLKLISAVQVIRGQTVLQIRVSSGIFLPSFIDFLQYLLQLRREFCGHQRNRPSFKLWSVKAGRQATPCPPDGMNGPRSFLFFVLTDLNYCGCFVLKLFQKWLVYHRRCIALIHLLLPARRDVLYTV